MKTFRTIQKWAVVIGLGYGFWVSSHVEATSADIRAGLVIVLLSLIVAISVATNGVKTDCEQ